MSKKVIREAASVKHIREFIGYVCDSDFAKANECLNQAVKEKMKALIRKDLKERN